MGEQSALKHKSMARLPGQWRAAERCMLGAADALLWLQEPLVLLCPHAPAVMQSASHSFITKYESGRIKSASALCPLWRRCEPRASYLQHYQPPPPSSPFSTSEYACGVYLAAHLCDLILIVTAALFTLYSCRCRSSERLKGNPTSQSNPGDGGWGVG